MPRFILNRLMLAGPYWPTCHVPSRTPPFSLLCMMRVGAVCNPLTSVGHGLLLPRAFGPPPPSSCDTWSQTGPCLISLLHDAVRLHQRSLLHLRGEPLPLTISTSNQVRARTPLPPSDLMSEFYHQRPSTSPVFRAVVTATPASW
jgi:hypothetical protein